MTLADEDDFTHYFNACGRLTRENTELRAEIERLRAALAQLLKECVAAGFDDARDYNWPKSLKDARRALEPTP